MRLRRKPWARPELAACHFFISDPPKYKGRWQELFNNNNPIHLELGCGKGVFISEMGAANQHINYIAVDIKSEVLALAKRKIVKKYDEAGITSVNNIKLMSHNIELIDNMLDSTDDIERIYINFCNPWPKRAHNKKRLTHSKQLVKYKTFLKDGGEIWFKTDNDELFQHSIKYFEENGFIIKYITEDLHASGFEGSIPTEHEIMFTEQGIPTKFLIALLNK
ncbi:tRNA (guanosine(46)-N7)-methyltransferase TrmB [Ruminiclostridium herbifermentans]|uniref:tRNA (guanine-N(7)-)-methyltransferase n=1 Tax=Ruminiclostridium herbifermentans TaxID=2488810 RepID=A0A4V6EQY1_9FIRM|nr:tRNA (guanosine(46)-N7)-methyltransferase TrmB [Ruminiclostridium herbifermentans]QNU65978.1 tRNA (guanosine(46)-N7)-methyltransferase TrmB [Ruminiclostridium herbifermentans]